MLFANSIPRSCMQKPIYEECRYNKQISGVEVVDIAGSADSVSWIAAGFIDTFLGFDLLLVLLQLASQSLK